MAGKTVECTGRSNADAGAVWEFVQDFARPWHPAIDWMQAETGPSGETQRRFTVTGDDSVYVERLTYLSHSDRVMGYTALEGIKRASAYNATLHVEPASDGGAMMTWRAEISATEDRLADIADGTRIVFEAGLAALMDLPPSTGQHPTLATPKVTLENRVLDHTPNLGISVAPAGLKQAEHLCIFLHGIGGQKGNWTQQLEVIGAQIPAVALDLRGYGDSELGHDQSTIDAYCGDILALKAIFQAEKIILCGLSYGSWIATSFAMRHPDILAGLVLSGGCTGMSEASPDERNAFRASREVPLDAGKTPADFAPDVIKIIAGPSASDAVRAEMLSSMAGIPTATYRDALTCFTNPPETFDFAKIPCPVLLMTGEHDRLAPPKEIREVSQRMHAAAQTLGKAADIQFEMIPDAGHICNLESPSVFNQHLLTFVKKFKTQRPAEEISGKALRKQQKKQRILDAALGEFSKNGFSGASMDAIAKRAKVSKPTLYQYLGAKADLLAAVLDQGKSELLAPFKNVAGKPMVAVLWQFAWTYADFVLRPDMLSLARLIIGEAERLPDVAQSYQANGPLKALAGIMAYLEAQKDQGKLMFEDPELAAQSLWSLLLSPPREFHLHHAEAKPDQNDVARYLINGLRVFLRAYSVNSEQDIAALDAIIAKTPTA